jgi:branched-chain amino acid transport system ATP-binding protein
MAEALLDIAGCTSRFGGVKATDNVNAGRRGRRASRGYRAERGRQDDADCAAFGRAEPDAGEDPLLGQGHHPVPTHRRSHFGMARSFQITSLVMNMSVIDNIALAVQAHDGTSFQFWQPAASERRLREPRNGDPRQVGLADRADTPAAAQPRRTPASWSSPSRWRPSHADAAGRADGRLGVEESADGRAPARD